MNHVTLYASCVFVLVSTTVVAFADQPPSKTDAEAFGKLRHIVNRKPFLFRDTFAVLPGEKAFCEGLMKDVQANRNVRVIEPYLRTDSITDPRLKPWKDCIESYVPPEPWKGGPAQYPVLGTRSVRAYRADIDNDPRNGLEDLLYAEWDFKDTPGPAGIAWWDLKVCKPMGGVPAEQDDKRNAEGVGTVGDNYALVLRYRGRSWVLTVRSNGSTVRGWNDLGSPPSYYRMELQSLRNSPESPRLEFFCAWDTYDPSSPSK